MGAPTPPVIQEAWAVDAAGGYITNPIPITTAVPGAASWALGFPPDTMTAITAGGVPPFGQDANGALFAISSHIVALEAGQPYQFNSTISGAISGYAAGAMLGTSDLTGLWINTVNGNVSNPDSGGAGWVSLVATGIGAVTGLTNINVTLSAAQAAKPIIELSGALTGNVQVIFPNTVQAWLVSNLCSGPYTVTCKTAAGTGIIVQQGGAPQASGLWGDGTNIYLAYGLGSVPPSSITPIASTLALRSNTGAVYATYFNQNSAINEDPNVGAFAVQNNLADGFLRWATPAWAGAALLGGNFTNAPPGIFKMPNGFTIQFGTTGALSPGYTGITFPAAFANACLNVQLTPISVGSGAQAESAVTSRSTTGFTVANGGTIPISFNWLAIGY